MHSRRANAQYDAIPSLSYWEDLSEYADHPFYRLDAVVCDERIKGVLRKQNGFFWEAWLTKDDSKTPYVSTRFAASKRKALQDLRKKQERVL